MYPFSPEPPSAPSHPRAARPVTQPGTGARGPGQPGHVQEEARPGEQTRAFARPPLHVSARLTRGPSTSSTGPRSAEVGTGNTLRGKSAPALPAARAPRRAPRGVAFPPAHDKVKLSRWSSFLALAARTLPALSSGSLKLAQPDDKRQRVSPSWCPCG